MPDHLLFCDLQAEAVGGGVGDDGRFAVPDEVRYGILRGPGVIDEAIHRAEVSFLDEPIEGVLPGGSLLEEQGDARLTTGRGVGASMRRRWLSRPDEWRRSAGMGGLLRLNASRND
jgi:hypothetical protein